MHAISFEYSLYLLAYSELSNSILTQRESLYYDGTVRLLLHNLQQVAGDVSLEEIDSKDPVDPSYVIKLFDVSFSLIKYCFCF